MGSSGSGNFGTYHTGTHNEGEGNGEIKCPQIIEMIKIRLALRDKAKNNQVNYLIKLKINRFS